MAYIVIAVSFGVAGAIVGKIKGSSFVLWFLISGLVPFFGLLAAIAYRFELVPPLRGEAGQLLQPPGRHVDELGEHFGARDPPAALDPSLVHLTDQIAYVARHRFGSCGRRTAEQPELGADQMGELVTDRPTGAVGGKFPGVGVQPLARLGRGRPGLLQCGDDRLARTTRHARDRRAWGPRHPSVPHLGTF